MVITFCNGKGGSGKTTMSIVMAMALAAAGRRVGVSDRDPQGTATLWLNDLGGEGGPVIAQPGGDYDVLIIDTPPRLEAPQVRDSIREADHVILVSSPSPADLWTTRKSAEVILSYLKKKESARILFNQVQPGTLLSKELGTMTEKIGLSALFNVVRRRQCYQHAAVLGWSGLTERAKEEVMMLAGEIASL